MAQGPFIASLSQTQTLLKDALAFDYLPIRVYYFKILFRGRGSDYFQSQTKFLLSLLIFRLFMKRLDFTISY
ncbi:hypothetical protein FGO68_gene1091 [Halteria grandinella]|uniref:Uncharacterized protein n=1 Tax=Halteria grandinella TaxID=5974 RepID=A0A8J8T9T4_HALGN|nr:hypothetical protein FGO68_gene1091 [Halteria grandinella]